MVAMLKIFKSFIPLLTIILLFGCSVQNLDRGPSSDLVLTAQEKIELHEIRARGMKFFMAAYGKSDEEKHQLIEQGRNFLIHELHSWWQARKEQVVYKSPEIYHWSLEDDLMLLSAAHNQKQISKDLVIQDMDELFSLVREDQSLLPKNLIGEELFSRQLDLFLSDDEELRRSSNLRLSESFDEQYKIWRQKIRELGNTLSNSSSIRLKQVEVEKFVKLFLNHYYANASEVMIDNIFSDLVHLKSLPTEHDFLVAMFRNSGPGMGKLLQALSKDPMMEGDMTELLELIESENKPVPPHMVSEVLSDPQSGFRFTEFNDRPLGTGTMAQVHYGKLLWEGSEVEVAVRFLKPGLRELVDKDIKVMKDFVTVLNAFPEIGPALKSNIEKMIDSLEDFLIRELDIADTIEKQILARTYYEQAVKIKVDDELFAIDVKVPKVYRSNSSNVKLHVQEFVNLGKKFSNLSSLRQQRAISRVLSQVWFEQAFLESGFVHADLHQGNFGVLELDDEHHLKMTLFDFGMSEQIDLKTRRSFLLIGLGAEQKKPHLIAEAFEKMSGPMDASHKAALTKAITDEMIKDGKTAENWILWGLQTGHLQSDQLGSLARGATLVSQMPATVGEIELTNELLKKMTLKKMAQGFFNPFARLPLTRRDLVTLGYDRVRESCSELMQKLMLRRQGR